MSMLIVTACIEVLAVLFAARAMETPRASCARPNARANMTCPLGKTCLNGTRSQWLVNFRTSDVCSECSPTQLPPVVVYSDSTRNGSVTFSTDGSYGGQLYVFLVPSQSAFISCLFTEDALIGQPNLTISNTVSVPVRDLDPGPNYFVASTSNEANTTSCSNGSRIEVIVARNNCSSTPALTDSVCGNHGPCVFDTQLGEFSCQCSESYTGRWCEEIDECYNNTKCQNGGQCLDGNCTFECDCVDGYSGVYCERRGCANNSCASGGLCYPDDDTPEGFTCLCLYGYTGRLCETDVDECLSIPCQNNGTCVDSSGNFTCNCTAGFKGKQCSEDVDECEGVQACEATQFCNNSYGGYECIPFIGWCQTSYCNSHGRCEILEDGRKGCSCAIGFTGPTCEYQLNEGNCFSNPCMNNGTCSDVNNEYVCDCISGFWGTFCEREIDECLSNPCTFGQEVCRDIMNGYKCVSMCGPCTRPPTVCHNSTISCQDVECGLGSVCETEGTMTFCRCPQGDYMGSAVSNRSGIISCFSGGRDLLLVSVFYSFLTSLVPFPFCSLFP